ncbi:hypothetical protein REMIM1_CH02046 [Rhizobium etli bv. mimosae str. Mim1]|nr:hypothetical protein REMIM1_CH02046 [Rhizobium etli bv. mimosae str. Mim1]
MTPHLAVSAPRVSGVPVGCSFALATPGKSKSSRLSMADRIDAARESIGRAIFESLDEHDLNELVRADAQIRR